MGTGLSLRNYLLSRLLWLILPIVAGVMAIHWYIERSLLVEVFDESLKDKAMSLATLVTKKEGHIELEFADEYIPQYSRRENPFFFQVWLPDGSTLERSRSLGGEELPYTFGTLDAPVTFSARLKGERLIRCVGIRFPDRLETEFAKNPATSVVIVIGADSSVLERTLAKGHLMAVLAGSLTALGIALVVYLGLRRGVRLIQRVTDEVQAITPNTLHQPLSQAAAPAEIRPIVQSLNDSRQTIQEFVEREQRFNADVAHELRTPIAELQAAAEVAQRWPDEEARDRLVTHAHAVAIRMGSLVDGLLELVRLEAGTQLGDPVEFDLARCVALQVEHASRKHGGSRSLNVQGPEALHVRSFPTLWEIVTGNLIANAMEHSDEGCSIHVHLRSNGDGPILQVSNPAQHLDEETAAHCTERLWRTEKDGEDTEHSGLGLSIVDAACARLGYRFEVRFARGVFQAVVGGREPG